MALGAFETSGSSGLVGQYQKYFERKLLEHAIQELRLNDYATQGELPKMAGAQTVRFTRRNVADVTNVQSLAEGVAPTTFAQINLTFIDVVLAQIGEVAAITDILSYTQLFDTLKEGIGLMGEDAALYADTLTRNIIVAGNIANVATNPYSLRFSQGLANWAALAAATTQQARFVRTDGLDAATRLKVNRAPKIGGSYVCIAPPQVTRDLMNDDDWIKASQYSAVKQLFKGEVGELDGVRYVEATNPFTEATNGAQGTYAAGGGILVSIFTGKGGYGVAKLAGDSPMRPRVVINDKPDKSDPLNQKIIAGWKAYYNAVLLNADWTLSLRSQTEFNG